MIILSAALYAAFSIGSSQVSTTEDGLDIGQKATVRPAPGLLAYQPPPPRPSPPPPPPSHREASLPRTDIYLLVAPGGESANGNTQAAFQAGAGVEEVLRHGLGLGVEASALGRSHDFGRSVSGIVSPNLYYHFLRSSRSKLDPFVTAGYSVLFRDNIQNAANVGAGLNYWFRPHTGVRFEARDQIMPDQPSISVVPSPGHRPVLERSRRFGFLVVRIPAWKRKISGACAGWIG